jgi:hypothetical protein
VDPESLNYFDLEDPVSLARLDEPMSALRGLQGLVVIDEIQRKPDLFPLLRVLSDRKPLSARFLILGSASPALLRQSSESLAGRIEMITISGFALSEAPGRFSTVLSGKNGGGKHFVAQEFCSDISRTRSLSTWHSRARGDDAALLDDDRPYSRTDLERFGGGPFARNQRSIRTQIY